MTYADDKVQLVETDLDVLSKAKPSEANGLLCTGTSYEDSLETSGATILAETKSIDSSELLPELAVQLTFALPASSYATMAIRELTKASTSVFPISQIIYLLLIQQNLFRFASATFHSLLETCKRPCRCNLLGFLPLWLVCLCHSVL
jgi:tRNA pseudouridine13 synthase